MMFRLALRFLWLMLLLSSWGLAAAQTGKRQALVIGLSSYAPPRPGRGGISHLPTGHRDAQRTADRLKTLGWEVTLLSSVPGATDSRAKKADILTALRKLGKNAEDQVLVVYSGHGFRVRSQDYLTAFDSHYDTTEETPRLVVDSLISVDKDLRDVFSGMTARRRLLVVDACRDTPTTETKGDGQSPDAGNFASKLGEVVGLSREGSVFAGVLFSCAPLERSYVDGDLDGGKGASVFTEGLLAALSDPKSASAGILRPELAAIQSATFVKAWAARRNKKMNPRWVPSPENDLTLGFELGRMASPVVVSGGNPAPVNNALVARVLSGHTSDVNAIAISPSGDTIASGGFDKTIRLWNAQSGEVRRVLVGHVESIQAISFSPDGAKLASAGMDGTIRIWDAQSGDFIVKLTTDSAQVRTLAFSPDGTTVACDASSGSSSYSAAMQLWDIRSGNLSRRLTGPSDHVRSLAFSSDGGFLVSAGNGKTIQLWDPRTGDRRQDLTGHLAPINSIAISRDGSTIASGSEDQTVRLWDARTGTLRFTLNGHRSEVKSVAFSPDGTTVASGSVDGTVRIWDARTGELRQTLTGHRNAVTSVAFFSDSKSVVSGSLDKTVRIWSLP